MSRLKKFDEQLKLIVLIGLFFLLILLYFGMMGFIKWHGDSTQHTIMETTAAILTTFIGLITLNRFYSRKNNTLLFIGCAFIGAALFEFNHVILTSQIFGSNFPTDLSRLTAWSWLSSQLFLAILLCLSWFVWYWGDDKQIGELRIYLAVSVLAAGTMIFFRTVSLPRVHYSEFPIINRPGELSAAFFYLLALIGYYKKGHWKTDGFEYALMLSISVGFMTQLLFMSSTEHQFDTAFNIAHVLKIISYSFVLLGAFHSMNALFKQAEQSKEELREAYESLQIEVVERKLTEAELKRSHASLMRAQKIAHIGNWELNLYHQVFRWSDEMYRIFHIKPGSDSTLTIEQMHALIHPDDLEQFQNFYQLCDDNDNTPPTSLLLDCRIMRPDGEIRHVHFESEIMRDAIDQMPLKLIGIAQDITDRKRSQERKLALILEKERIDILTNFITQAAHEFKTPLSIINMHAYILKRSTNLANELRKLDEIENQVENINTLIDALTTMAKLDGGPQNLPKSKQNINDIIQMIHTGIESSAKEKHIKIVMDLMPEPVNLQANISYLSQAISNIVKNAIACTAENGLINIHTRANQGKAIITIHDNGFGIPPESLPHIFERFYRADEAGTARGFGLGLPIANAIIQLHGGHIEVNSVIGEGTTVTLVLPIMQSA